MFVVCFICFCFSGSSSSYLLVLNMKRPPISHNWVYCVGSRIGRCPLKIAFCQDCHPKEIMPEFNDDILYRCHLCEMKNKWPLRFLKKHHAFAITGDNMVRLTGRHRTLARPLHFGSWFKARCRGARMHREDFSNLVAGNQVEDFFMDSDSSSDSGRDSDDGINEMSD